MSAPAVSTARQRSLGCSATTSPATETQTGVVESVTKDGEVKRVIRWRTKEGEIVTQTVEGPTRYRTLAGEEIFVPGPTTTVHDTRTVHDPGETVTLPGETVTVTVTVTGDPGTAGAP